MAEITASMVMALRGKTDAPMMDCKKALTEADGDAQRAEEILRVRFGNKASKASARIAAEGTVSSFISADAKQGCLIEINAETDFCAKNEEFQQFGSTLAKAVVDSNAASVEELATVDVDGKTVEEMRTGLIGKIGENITPRRFQLLHAKGSLYTYIHGAKLGVILDLEGGNDELGKDIAMHIAAAKPRAIDQSGVDAELIETERRVAIEKAKEAGKPEDMLEKIATGTVNKFLKEVTLLNQAFVKDDKLSIQDLLKKNNATVHSFTMYSVGEGIEKKQEDFAAEVAAASKV
ncbi:MAG: elongation factor Ts [Nitrosomonadales bacterium]|jgi:elongation factor Ts|nr:MAG: elongation factor Ts [Methylophilales bacterium BACL14 MAG-120920-bin58]MBT6391934.1 elongation factor Ts [Nitrosomonadales bacterium]|tara:strand:- start:2672 stop:3547 length:876 start_codon:yes stop_codon:yes gene_type:complete